MSIQVAKVREFKGHTQAVYTIAFDENKKEFFFSSGADGMLVGWNLHKDDGLLFARLNNAVYSICLYKNLLLSGENNGTLTIFNIDSKAILLSVKFNASPIFDIKYYNNHFLIASGNGQLIILNEDFKCVKNLILSEKSIRKILISGDEIFLAGSEGIVWKLDPLFNIDLKITAENHTIFALAYHNSKNNLLTGGRSALLKLWHQSAEIKSINAHLLHINDIAFNLSQQYFTTCSMDKTIKIWDGENCELIKVIDHNKMPAHQSSVNKILWIGINRFISCSDDRTILCFEILE